MYRPSPEEARLGLRAMKTVATSGGSFPAAARRLLEASQRMFLGTSEDLDTLPLITKEAFAEAFTVPELREQLTRAMVVLSLVSGKPDPEVTEEVRAFAQALEVDEPGIAIVEKLAHGSMLLGKLDWLRRSHLRDVARTELERNVAAGIKAFLGLRGLMQDDGVAEPFLALEALPEGTLGRALFDHYRRHSFALPGERHGFPEGGVYHDLSHVLGGYDTDPLGELQVGAFTAGYRKKNPLFVAMLPLLLFCAEINVTPIPHDRVGDFFAEPGVPEAFFAALERGSRVNVDLSDRWDFWPFLPMPIEDARAALGL